MKKQLITVTLLLLACLPVLAQKEYRLAKSTGKLHLNLNGVTVEGYDGNEIIFSGQKTQDDDEDERAKGLQAISSSGYKDNTGLGINVTEKGQDVYVNLIGNGIENELLYIRVPKQLAIAFAYDKFYYVEPVTIKNVKGEVEITASYNNIVLENNSGPMNITTIQGSVDAIFENDIKGPVSIISIHEHVDVALPAATKANLELGTHYGKLYAADAFDIAVVKDSTVNENQNNRVIVVQGRGTTNAARVAQRQVNPPVPPEAQSAVTLTNQSSTFASAARTGYRELIKGTVNGGGTDLIFKSTHGNVYLRTR